MAQHDFDITTQDANTGITFRAAINAALQALAGCSSGGTAPANPYPYQLWADTTNNQLKIRTGDNASWVVVGTLDAVNLGLLALSGGTMTGLLTLSGDPTSSLHATTRQFVESGRIKITEKTGNYTLTTMDCFILANATAGGFTLTLPLATGNGGKFYVIKKNDGTTNAVTIAASGSDKIDGEASKSLTYPNEHIVLVSDDNTDWRVYGGTTGYTPVIKDFTNAQHNHTSAGQGGLIDLASYLVRGRVYLPSNQGIPNATVTILSLASSFDPDNIWDNTNRRYTPSKAGYYFIGCQAQWTPGGSASAVKNTYIYKNGAEASKRQDDAGSTAVAREVTDLIYFNGSTDYADFRVYQNGGSAIDITGGATITFAYIFGPF